MWRPGRDFVPPLTQGLHFRIVCYPFCYLSIPVGIGSSVSILSSLDAFAGSFAFETFLTLNYCLTLVYNLIYCHLWNARVQLFPCRFQIVFIYVFIFRQLRAQHALVIYMLLPARMMSWVYIMTSTLVTVCYTSHLMQYFQARTSTCGLLLIGILFGARFFM
jgi:hypothetical protein